MNMACFKRQSTITRMVLKPEKEGSFLMKSIEIEFHDVMLQANFPQKITFDMLYTNGFLIRICSRTLSIFSECNTT